MIQYDDDDLFLLKDWVSDSTFFTNYIVYEIINRNIFGLMNKIALAHLASKGFHDFVVFDSDTLTKEEQKEEESRRFNEGSCRSANNSGQPCYEREYEKIVNKLKAPPQAQVRSVINFIEDSDEKSDPPPAKAPVKSILSMIDDSDEEEDDCKIVRIKDNKIMKALGCEMSECDFID